MGRVLVTGATGYIGSHTIVELISAGFEVVGVDNFSNSSPEVLKGIEKIIGKQVDFVEADCSDLEAFSEIFKNYTNIDSAIHFAASKAVGESVEKPLLYYKNNLSSLLNLIELMGAKKRSSIVFSSSCTVYGQPDSENLPVSEKAPWKPALSPYGKTKQMSEDILMDCSKAINGLNVIALRYFNPIGAHPSAHIGELPIGVPQNLVPYITQTAAGKRERLSIFGNDYDTPDGTCIRDYIYVCDLAKAHVSAMRRLVSGENSEKYEIFNLGTGNGLSVLELVNGFMSATGVDVPYKFAPRREGDIEQVWAEPTKANNILGWRADTPIEDVLRSAWKWQQKIN